MITVRGNISRSTKYEMHNYYIFVFTSPNTFLGEGRGRTIDHLRVSGACYLCATHTRLPYVLYISLNCLFQYYPRILWFFRCQKQKPRTFNHFLEAGLSFRGCSTNKPCLWVPFQKNLQQSSLKTCLLFLKISTFQVSDKILKF